MRQSRSSTLGELRVRKCRRLLVDRVPRDHPLAIYVFSPEKEVLAKGKRFDCIRWTRLTQCPVFDNTESGAAVANETVISCGGSSALTRCRYHARLTTPPSPRSAHGRDWRQRMRVIRCCSARRWLT